MKKFLIVLLCLLIVLGIGGYCGYRYYHNTYLKIGEETYRRDIQELDFSNGELPGLELLKELTGLQKLNLLGTGLTAEQYEDLHGALPECEILWELPFQGGYLPLDTEHLQLVEVEDGDIKLLSYLQNLQSIDATAVVDLDAVVALEAAYPEVEIYYQVPLAGQNYPKETTQLTVENADVQELMTQLAYLPQMTDITFTGTAPENEAIYELMQTYPGITCHWEFMFFNIPVTSDTTELDLSGIPMENVETLENGLKYFNNLQKVVMCDTGLSNEEIDGLWKRHPETRFVWNVQIGRFKTRTDIIYLMPFQYGYDGTKGICLNDRDCTEMKYLVDLICLDMGHMEITSVEFLRYMPNMQYLIIADTYVKDLSPMENLTNLKFFEAWKCGIQDISPLLGCTSLEDVNLCNNPIEDISLLGQIESLNNIWISGVNWPQEQKDILNAAKPDAKIVYHQNKGSTGAGWRYLDNYYNHRDVMGMFYLDDEQNAYWTRPQK